MKASAKDLRVRSNEIFESLLRGEEIELTYRGKKIADIIPLKSKSKTHTTQNSDEAFGMWSDYEDTEEVSEYVRQIRQTRNKV